MEATLDELHNHEYFQTTGHIGAHWQNLSDSLKDGRQALRDLEQLLVSLNTDRYLRLMEASDTLYQYRQHVQLCRDATQFSVQTITLYVFYGCPHDREANTV